SVVLPWSTCAMIAMLRRLIDTSLGDPLIEGSSLWGILKGSLSVQGARHFLQRARGRRAGSTFRARLPAAPAAPFVRTPQASPGTRCAGPNASCRPIDTAGALKPKIADQERPAGRGSCRPRGRGRCGAGKAVQHPGPALQGLFAAAKPQGVCTKAQIP